MNEQNIPAYLLGNIKVKDHEAYMEQYALPVLKLFEQFGAEVLVGDPAADVLEGEWDGNWTVVVRFPSLQKAREFYNSKAYVPYLELRQNALTDGGTVIITEGIDPAVLEQIKNN